MFTRFSRLLNRFIALTLVLALAMIEPAFADSKKAVVSSSSAKFYQYASSSSEHVDIPKDAEVKVSSVNGKWAKVKYHGHKGYMKVSDLSGAKDSSSSSSSSSHPSWKSKVVAMKWFDGGSSVLKKDHYGYIYDIKSGSTIKVYRMGGHYHADIEPATASDAKKLRKLGNSWSPRPVILYAGGKFVAASINTKAHGDQTITSNGFDGQVCLHMLGSKTHGGEQVRGDHQSAIEKAYKWAHK